MTCRSRRGPSWKRSAAAMNSSGCRMLPSGSTMRSSTSKWRRSSQVARSGTIDWQYGAKRRSSMAARTRWAERMTSVRSRDSSLSGNATWKRPPPCSLAAAQAAPASDSSASKPGCGAALGTMPMLAVIASMLPFQAGRSASMPVVSLRASAVASRTPASASSANSSPPMRATSAFAPASERTTLPTLRSSSSPAAWLLEELTSLNWSRSR